MKILIAIFLSLFAFTYFECAKAGNIDSLKIEIKSSTSAQDSIVDLIALTKSYLSLSIDSTFYYGQIAIEQAEKLKDTASLAQVYKYLGISCYYTAFYEKSLEYSQKSNEFYKKLNDISGLAKTYNNMAIIYGALGKYDIALEHYNNSLKIWNHINEDSPDDPETKINIANLYNNIGAVYANIGEKEKAKEYYNKSYAIAKQYNDIECMSLALSNRGNALFADKEYQKALEDMFESLRLIESLDNKYSLAVSMGSISGVYLELKKYDTARFYLNQVLSIAKKIKANELIKNAYKGLYMINKETGNYETALKYQSLYYQLYDSIYSKETNNKIDALHNKYIFEKKEQEIKLLVTEQQLNDIQLRNSRIWLLVLIGGIVILLIFIGLIYFQMTRKRRANIELVLKNRELVKSEKYIREHLKIEQQRKYLSPKKNQADKYATSTLTEEQKEDLKLLIINTMENEKLYLDSNFSIVVFSKHLNVSRTYISQVINEKFNMNFNNFINEYRIKEALHVLTDEANNYLTIETIALSIGFRSKSSFNSAFKKYTGITPSFYMKTSR